MPELVWHSADAPQIWRSWPPPPGGDDEWMWAARKGAVALIFLCAGALFACCLPRTAASTDGQMASIREQTHLLLVPAAIGNAGAPPRRALHLDGRAWG